MSKGKREEENAAAWRDLARSPHVCGKTRRQAETNAAACEGMSVEEWEAQGGDAEGEMRTVCHECERMFPMDQMTEDDRYDNICPQCVAGRQISGKEAGRE